MRLWSVIPGRIAALATALLLACSFAAAEPLRNGFDLAGALVPVEEILQGGPPKDGIPAIDRPVFVGAREATDLRPGDMVLAIQHKGIAKAYPVRILNWHEVVNDRFGSERNQIRFMSSNGWDARAAKGYGFDVVWCNRFGQAPEQMPEVPDGQITTLAELPAILNL